MLICFVISVLLLVIYWVVAVTENRLKDRSTGRVVPPGDSDDVTTLEGFVDLTDREQENFRYMT